MRSVKNAARELSGVLRDRLSKFDIWKLLKLIRGIAIFIAAVLILSYTTNFVLQNKIEMRFGLTGFESVTPEMPDFETIIMSRAVQLLIVLFIIVAIISLMAIFSGANWKFVSLLTLVLHSFIIVAICSCLQIPFIMQLPKTSFTIVGVSMQNVTFYNACMTGITPQGEVSITSEVIKASYVRAFRVYSNMSMPIWSSIPMNELDKVLENTITYLNMSDVTWLSKGVEMHLDKLDLSSGNWTAVEYARMIQRLPVRAAGPVTFHETMLSVLFLASMIGMVLYNSIGFKRLYDASIKLTLVAGIIMFLALMIFGLI